MVLLRGLGWPQKNTVKVTRLQRSDLSQTTPSSPREIETPSVQNIVGQLEAKEEQSRRTSSVGDTPSTPIFRVSPFLPVILLPRTPSPSPATVSKTSPMPKGLAAVQEEAGRGLKARSASPELEGKALPRVFTTAEGGSIYHPCSILPAPPVGGDDSGLDFNPHPPPSSFCEAIDSTAVDLENLHPLPDSPFTFSQSPRTFPRISQRGTEELSPLASPFAPIRQTTPLSPLNLAVDSAADPPARPESPRPNTPLSFYRLDPSSAVTFNTSVRDLIQEDPDTPIGGKAAAGIEGRTATKMAAHAKSAQSAPKPKKPLKSHSNYSDSMPHLSRKEEHSSISPEPFASPHYAMISPRPVTPMSDASVNMVTASDTSMFGRRNEYSDLSDISFDGSPGPGPEVKDFAKITEITEVICPDCNLPTAEPANASNGPSLPSSRLLSSGVPFSARPPSAGPTSAGPSLAGPSAAGPSSAGPSSTGPSLAGPSLAGPSSAGPSSAGPSLAGPSSAGPSSAGPSLAGPSLASPSLTGPSLAGPSLTGPSLAGPSLTGPSLTGPSVAGPSLAGPSSAGPSSSVPSRDNGPPGVPISNLPPSNLPTSGVSPTGAPAADLPSTKVPSSGLSPSGVPLAPGLYVPSSNLSRGLAVPADITGQLDPPGTPVPSKKRVALEKGKKKGQKVIRRGRCLILRRPVLAMVVGRQLAGPTSTALELVSHGTPVDPTVFKDVAIPGAFPQQIHCRRDKEG